MDGDGEQSSDENLTILYVNDLVPRYWHTRPRAWFKNFESILSNYKITLNDDQKYAFVIKKMKLVYLKRIQDFILNPPENDKYNALIRRIILQELSLIELGDEKPSILLESIESYRTNDLTDDAVLLLWMEKLPREIRVSLSKNLNLTIAELKSMADDLMEQYTKKLSSMDDFSQEIDELKGKVEGLCIIKKKSTSNRSLRSGSRSGSVSEEKLCWYHNIYGDNAINCVSPCSRRPKPESHASPVVDVPIMKTE